jgi:hypothetical protein
MSADRATAAPFEEPPSATEAGPTFAPAARPGGPTGVSRIDPIRPQ